MYRDSGMSGSEFVVTELLLSNGAFTLRNTGHHQDGTRNQVDYKGTYTATANGDYSLNIHDKVGIESYKFEVTLNAHMSGS